mgnify:CR=1 FL=1
MLPDIRAKARIAALDLKALRRGLFKFASVTQDVKCRIASLTVLTSFDYNCSVWPKLNLTEAAAFHKGGGGRYTNIYI